MPTKFTTLAIAALFALSACGNKNDTQPGINAKDGANTLFAQPNNKFVTNFNDINGVWESRNLWNSNTLVLETYRLEVREGFITLANRCQFQDGAILYSQVSGRAQVRRQRLIVRESSQVTEALGNYQCTARIMRLNKQNSTQFRIDRNGLTITVNEDGPRTYEKISD